MIEVKAQGTGGMSEFKANLGESLAWGAFKCIAVDNREVSPCVGASFPRLLSLLLALETVTFPRVPPLDYVDESLQPKGLSANP